MESRDTSDARHDEHADEPVEQKEQPAGGDAEGASPEDTAPDQGGESGESDRGETEDQAEDKARDSINKAFE